MAGFNETLKWTFGLINCSHLYLTAETFQSKINCNGKTLKKKQIWTLERVSETAVALKASTGRYLTAERSGNLTASGESVGEDQQFEFQTQDDGRIVIKSVAHGRYVGGSGDKMNCFDKPGEIGPMNSFTIHLAIHPQINLRNYNRKTYCHLVDEEIRCDEAIPWGYDAMLILEFHDGMYALRAANTKYLAHTGDLIEVLTKDALYTLVFRNAQVAFRDRHGRFLTAVGASATIMARKDTIGKDELFVLEDSHPQVRLVASNGKYVSIRDKQEVRANQSTCTDAEIFQMEAVDRSDRSGNVKWAFHASNKKYWNSGATLTADKDDFSLVSSQFTVEWMGPLIAFRATNGKYISVKPNGQIAANTTELTDQCKFVFEFINRPILVLRGGFGFVGVKGNSGILECNRSHYDVFGMEVESGTYYMRSANGKFWNVESDASVAVTSDKKIDYFIELRAHTHMCLVAPNGQYIKGAQSGAFSATGGSSVDDTTLWEY